MKRPVPFFLGTAILSLALAGTASGVGIAASGACATPDRAGLAIRADAAEAADEESDDNGRSASARSVGPARHRFLPTSVGAGPAPVTAALGPPSTTRSTHPGACGSAGSICTGQISPTPRATLVTRTVTRRRLQRGTQRVVDPGAGTGCGGAGFGCNETARPRPSK